MAGRYVLLIEMFTVLIVQTVYSGPVDQMTDYFAEQGCSFPPDVNPAEFMIDVVSGSRAGDRDWAELWLSSAQCAAMMATLDKLNREAQDKPVQFEDDEFAAPFKEQVRLVCQRASIQVGHPFSTAHPLPDGRLDQLWRDTEYVMNKILLHISTCSLQMSN